MAAAMNNRTLRLIIIDSDSATRIKVRTWMADRNVRVIGEADNNKAGLRLIRGLQPDLVLLELPVSASETMEVVKKISEEQPDTNIILSSSESSPQLILSCIRAGAQEFVARPVDEQELDKAINHIRKLMETSISSNKRRGTILSIFSGKGGIGASSIAANLGVAFADRPETKTVIVDLSFQIGDLSLMLDHPPKYSLTDALNDEGVLDDSKLRSILTQHSSGAYMLTVAASPEIGEEINRQHMIELFGTLNTMFDYVIVDVGRHLDDRTVEVLELSDGILLVASQDLPTVRNVSRYIDIFEQLEIERERILLIVNRFHKKSRLSLKDIEETLDMDTFWAIPNDFVPMSMGIDGGVPAVLETPRSKVAQSFKGLVESFWEMNSDPTIEPAEATSN